jgi:hypothetical protein
MSVVNKKIEWKSNETTEMMVLSVFERYRKAECKWNAVGPMREDLEYYSKLGLDTCKAVEIITSGVMNSSSSGI